MIQIPVTVEIIYDSTNLSETLWFWRIGYFLLTLSLFYQIKEYNGIKVIDSIERRMRLKKIMKYRLSSILVYFAMTLYLIGFFSDTKNFENYKQSHDVGFLFFNIGNITPVRSIIYMIFYREALPTCAAMENLEEQKYCYIKMIGISTSVLNVLEMIVIFW